MRIDGPQVTGSFTINETTFPDLSALATTGSNLFKGTQTHSGSIIPAVNNVYDLGSSTHQFRHVYISSGSLYIDGTKVLGSTSSELQITTDVGQSFKILEAGSDNITLQSVDGNIELKSSGGGDVVIDPTNGVIGLKGTVTIYTGNKIVSSDGNSLQFGNGIAVTGSIVSTVTPLVSGSSQITYSGLTGTPSGIISGSSQITSLGYATTGSNNFQGIQTITGSLFISSDLVVQGSSSLQNITASAVNIGANIVNLNTANPAIRFAGLNIFDSGSIGGSGSFLYDAVQDEFIFIHRGDGTNITSSVVMVGPQTYNNVGNEIYPTNNRILKSVGNEHVGDSIISETGGGIGISGSLSITGSIIATGTSLVSGSSQISGITNSQLTNSSFFVGTTSISLGRTSTAQTLNGVSIDGNAATVTGGVYTSGDQSISGVKTFSTFINSANGVRFLNSGAFGLSWSSTYDGSIASRIFDNSQLYIWTDDQTNFATVQTGTNAEWYWRQGVSNVGSGGNISMRLIDNNLTVTGAISGSNLSGTNTGDQNLSNYLTLDGTQTITGIKTINNNLLFANSGTSKRGIQGVSGVNDYWFIGGGATAENTGFLEIATGDDAQTTGTSEPIYVSQYGPGDVLTGTLFRRATLLDANGNTSFPGTLSSNGATLGCGVSTGRGVYGPGTLNLVLLSSSSGSDGVSGIDFRSGNNYPSDGASIYYENSQTGTGEVSRLVFRVENDLNDSILMRAGYHVYNARTVDNASQGADNPIFRWQYLDNNRMSLDSSGNLVCSGGISGNGSPSDARLKTIKETVKEPIKKIMKISGYRFDWNEINTTLNIKEDVGVIAQEISDILPELTKTDENGYMSVRYQGLTALFIEAIKEQQGQIEELKEIIKRNNII